MIKIISQLQPDGSVRLLVDDGKDRFYLENMQNVPEKEVLAQVNHVMSLKLQLAGTRSKITRYDQGIDPVVIEVTPHHCADGKVEIPPPAIAEAMVSFLVSQKFLQAQLGDMQEQFIENCRKLGPRSARRLYWIAVAKTFFEWIKRLGVIAFVINYARAKLGW